MTAMAKGIRKRSPPSAVRKFMRGVSINGRVELTHSFTLSKAPSAWSRRMAKTITVRAMKSFPSLNRFMAL